MLLNHRYRVDWFRCSSVSYRLVSSCIGIVSKASHAIKDRNHIDWFCLLSVSYRLVSLFMGIDWFHVIKYRYRIEIFHAIKYRYCFDRFRHLSVSYRKLIWYQLSKSYRLVSLFIGIVIKLFRFFSPRYPITTVIMLRHACAHSSAAPYVATLVFPIGHIYNFYVMFNFPISHSLSSYSPAPSQ